MRPHSEQAGPEIPSLLNVRKKVAISILCSLWPVVITFTEASSCATRSLTVHNTTVQIENFFPLFFKC
jgi:hypothetical protein